MPEIQGAYDIHDEAVVSVIDDLPLWSAPFGLKLLEVVRLGRDLRLLDVGSGTGFPVVELSQRLGPSCECFALDPWPEAVERMRTKIRIWGLGNLTVVEGRAEEMPFEDGSFDLVTSNNGINNTDDEQKVLSEVVRVARPGAQVVVTANLPDTMTEFYRAFRRVLVERGMKAALAAVDHHIHAKRKPLGEFRAMMESVGLSIAGTHEDSFAFRFTDSEAMFNHHVMKLAFIDGWRQTMKPDDVDSVFEELSRRLDDESGSGGLRLSVPFVCFDARVGG